MKNLFCTLTLLVLAACGGSKEEAAAPVPPPEVPAETVEAPAPVANSLADILAAQPAEAQARYAYRHPQATLEFFGIQPGQVVVEVLPGTEGWYTKILLPWLGSDGRLIAVNYGDTMLSKFPTFTEEQMAKMATWTTDFVTTAEGWRGASGAPVEAFVFGKLPESMHGTADAVLLIRAMHNLARFETDGGFLTAALADVNAVLKPGGIVGIVQHEAREDMPDDWANGNAGYLKRSYVVAQMQAAGFELVDQAEFNQNPNDQPTAEDFVWRLPPNYATSGEDAQKRAAMDAIGESNRMTLKFRKV